LLLFGGLPAIAVKACERFIRLHPHAPLVFVAMLLNKLHTQRSG